MPVKRYRDVADMDDARRYEPGSPELFQAMRGLWSFDERVRQPNYPPGVYRHRTVEDLYRQEEAWEKANVRALEERRRRKVTDDATVVQRSPHR